MAKKQHWAFPKFPKHARRITNAAGERVWSINGREFTSKRDYFEQLQAAVLKAKEAIEKQRELEGVPGAVQTEE